MKLNPLDIKDGETVFDAFPVLKKYPECKARVGNIEPATLLLYAILVYSKESDLASEKDQQKLKDAAARRVGWRKNKKGDYPESVQRIISGGEPAVNRMIYRIFRLQNDLEWAGYKADIEAYWQLIEQMNIPITEDNDDDKKLKAVELKLKLSESKKSLLKSINEMHHTLFRQDKTLEGAVAENDLEESDYGESIAERMARESQQGK